MQERRGALHPCRTLLGVLPERALHVGALPGPFRLMPESGGKVCDAFLLDLQKAPGFLLLMMELPCFGFVLFCGFFT